MSEVWPSVPLGEVLKHRKEFIQIDDEQTYKRCRVQLHANGIVLRDAVEGTKIKTKKQQVVKKDEFLVAEIDAKLGGFGIVTADLEGAIVSSHYFLYQINEELIDRRFFGFYIRTPAFREQVGARGSTNYAAIRPHHVLEYITPLPPLSEQRRIVGRLEHLASKIEEARGLRQKVNTEISALPRSVIFQDAANAAMVPMSELVRLKAPDVTVQAHETYSFAGVYSFGRGVFRGDTKRGDGFKYPKLTRVSKGNFTYPKLMAWEGALGVVPPEADGLVVSTEFPVFEVNTARVFPEVLDTYFRTPSIWPSLAEASAGTNVRRRRLHPSNFMKLLFPLPSKEVQLQHQEVLKQSQKALKLQAQTRGELDALLPSVLDKAFRSEL